LDLQGPQVDPVAGVEAGDRPWSLWRYRDALPRLAGAVGGEVSLGEGLTPLLPAGEGLWWKLDQVMPTRSFKDRGASVLLSLATSLGVRQVAVDSSGNAGIAVAAYAARAGMTAEVYLPASTSAAKRQVIESYGARVVAVPGDRAAAADAAQAAVAGGRVWYASHVYRAAFGHGVKTLAFELWEQLGGRAPGTVVVPAGNGTLVLGLWLGFGELVRAGRADRMPAIVAVQSERCAPLAGRPPSSFGPTVAAGIAIASPPRAGEVRAAVVASGGRVVTVPEESLAPAVASLAARGVAVEATAATVWAAWGLGAGPVPARPRGVADRPPVVLVLTGGR
jgi:threonine synthase